MASRPRRAKVALGVIVLAVIGLGGCTRTMFIEWRNASTDGSEPASLRGWEILGRSGKGAQRRVVFHARTGFKVKEGSYESDGIHETWWRVDGRVLSQSSVDVVPTGQKVTFFRKTSPPWRWGVADQTAPSMPEWMKDDAKWQAALYAQE